MATEIGPCLATAKSQQHLVTKYSESHRRRVMRERLATIVTWAVLATSQSFQLHISLIGKVVNTQLKTYACPVLPENVHAFAMLFMVWILFAMSPLELFKSTVHVGIIHVDELTHGIESVDMFVSRSREASAGQMLLELNKATEELENWKSGKGFILYGSNNIFCSGGDLAMSRATTNEAHGFAISSFVQKITTRLRTLPMMSVALIEGVALGGGAEISVAACDWRIMTPDSKIGYVHGKMGLVPGWGGGVALKRLVGASVALDLIMSARLVSAKEALKIGLANEILKTSDNALEQAQDWLQERVTVSVDILRAAKILMNFGTSDEELKLERSLQAPLWAILICDAFRKAEVTLVGGYLKFEECRICFGYCEGGGGGGGDRPGLSRGTFCTSTGEVVVLGTCEAAQWVLLVVELGEGLGWVLGPALEEGEGEASVAVVLELAQREGTLWSLRWKLRSQKGHWCLRSAEWMSRCRISLNLEEKALEHSEHANGRSPLTGTAEGLLTECAAMGSLSRLNFNVNNYLWFLLTGTLHGSGPHDLVSSRPTSARARRRSWGSSGLARARRLGKRGHPSSRANVTVQFQGGCNSGVTLGTGKARPQLSTCTSLALASLQPYRLFTTYT
ncbi:hypothetical protein B566_EDAN014907 [Ephemera danica]|nr:hypothetical protein B566_EDAN014907 [Ephemera danica]